MRPRVLMWGTSIRKEICASKAHGGTAVRLCYMRVTGRLGKRRTVAEVRLVCECQFESVRFLLPNAERGKDGIEHIIIRRGSNQLIEQLTSPTKIICE